MRQPARLGRASWRTTETAIGAYFLWDSERTIWRLAHWLTDDTLGKVPLTSFFFFFSLLKRKASLPPPRQDLGFLESSVLGVLKAAFPASMT